MTLFGALQSNAIAWIFASSTRCLMTLSSMAICTNPVCVLLPPPYDSPTLEFEERELRRLVQVRARASLCQCVGRVYVFVIGYFEQLLLLHASRGDQPFQ